MPNTENKVETAAGSQNVSKRTEIAYSYPTSLNATKFGFYHVGCWTVETYDNYPHDFPKARQAFDLDTPKDEMRKWAHDCLPSYVLTRDVPEYPSTADTRAWTVIQLNGSNKEGHRENANTERTASI